MRKKLLCFSIIYALILSGCSGSMDTTAKESETTTEATTETMPETMPEKIPQNVEEEIIESDIPDGFTATGVYTDDADKINRVKELLGDTSY